MFKLITPPAATEKRARRRAIPEWGNRPSRALGHTETLPQNEPPAPHYVMRTSGNIFFPRRVGEMAESLDEAEGGVQIATPLVTV